MPADLTRVPEYYHKYINKVKQPDLGVAFKEHSRNSYEFFKSIPEEKWDHRYAEGKWSIRDLLQHLIDAERIFSYRALRFARKDATPLPGFEENEYAVTAKAESRTSQSLLAEWQAVNRSTESLFDSFTEDQLEESGVASGASTYVRAIGFIICGHAVHHMEIIRERYL
jgi:uncharacterized damage-inducible protein DinB